MSRENWLKSESVSVSNLPSGKLRVAHLFFFLSPLILIIPHNMSRKILSTPVQKQTKSRQTNRLQYSVFIKLLSQRFTIWERIGLHLHRKTQCHADSSWEKSQAKDLHGKLKDTINGWKIILFTAWQNWSGRTHQQALQMTKTGTWIFKVYLWTIT